MIVSNIAPNNEKGAVPQKVQPLFVTQNRMTLLCRHETPHGVCQAKRSSCGYAESSACNLTRTQATRANSNGLGSTVNDCLYLANVGLPRTIGFTVRVRYVLTVHNALTTDTTFCHYLTPPYYGFRLADYDFLIRQVYKHKTTDCIIPQSFLKCKCFSKKN